MRIKQSPDEGLSPEELVKKMAERKPLPLGREEFTEWSDRIISGALLPADHASQKFALCGLLLHLGPTEDHKEDAFFIHSLRKLAVNQVADMLMKEFREEAKAIHAAEEAKKALKDPETWKSETTN